MKCQPENGTKRQVQSSSTRYPSTNQSIGILRPLTPTSRIFTLEKADKANSSWRPIRYGNQRYGLQTCHVKWWSGGGIWITISRSNCGISLLWQNHMGLHSCFKYDRLGAEHIMPPNNHIKILPINRSLVSAFGCQDDLCPIRYDNF
jgi:hypothetical protein